MKKRMMLIINPMAGRSGYKNGFGEVMNILDSGGYLKPGEFPPGRGGAAAPPYTGRWASRTWTARAC